MKYFSYYNYMTMGISFSVLFMCISISYLVSFSISVYFILSPGLSPNFGQADSARLAGRQVPGILLSLYSWSCEYIIQSCTPLPVFSCFFGNLNPGPMLVWQALYWLSCVSKTLNIPILSTGERKENVLQL